MRRNLARAMELSALGKEVTALRRQEQVREVEGQTRVVERLLHLHGLPQKIGQILSLTELDRESHVFTRLVETAAQLPASVAFAEIDRALGRPWRDCFQSLSPQGIGASLAQVHRGTLWDGRDVAVKIQYPGMAESLALDLKALGWLTLPIGGFRKGFDVAGYRRELGEMLKKELDYQNEGQMLKRFRLLASNMNDVAVPNVIEEYSGSRILTMTWVDGESFRDARRWSVKEKSRIARALLSLFFIGFFSAHMIHADPHPGNYRFQRTGEGVTVAVLDFGCVKIFDSETVDHLQALIDDTVAGRLKGNPELARTRFERLAFQPLLLEPMQHVLPKLCEILFEPFCMDRPFDMKIWHLGARVEETLGNARWNFRMAGPPKLVYFLRAYQGLVQYLSALDVPVNWRAEYDRAVDNRRPTQSCEIRSTTAPLSSKSQALRIRVSRGGRTKAELTFPAAAAESLSDLIPPEVGPKLIARNIDVSQISRSLSENGFPPGNLFSLREGQDEFRVWLE